MRPDQKRANNFLEKLDSLWAKKKEADAIKELKKDERYKQAYALEQEWRIKIVSVIIFLLMKNRLRQKKKSGPHQQFYESLQYDHLVGCMGHYGVSPPSCFS